LHLTFASVRALADLAVVLLVATAVPSDSR
jgi:hypothetical protein